MADNIISHRRDIDSLKGICIITVVLYHMGLLRSGYLGVDVFFVINGYLLIPSLVKRISSNNFSYFKFIERRSVRLLPLIVISSILVMAIGYFLMLPDNFENLAQSVVASNLMSENILSAITTKNYWDVSNELKPLMHLWYVGILFEFYIVMPLILLILNKFAILFKKNSAVCLNISLIILFFVSFILYILPIDTVGNKFYFLHYRIFELLLGGICGVYFVNIKHFKSVLSKNITSIGLVLLLFLSVFPTILGNNVSRNVVVGMPLVTDSGLPIPSCLALILTVVLTGIVISIKDRCGFLDKAKVLPIIGRMSYSIYIWHQIILAFYRYSISTSINLSFVVFFIISLLVISLLSYYLIEKKISVSGKTLLGWGLSSLLIIALSSYVYNHAGVVRDVPELGVVKGQEHRGMFAEYCDRVYQYKDYPRPNNGKMNILVVGISFGRDFANVLLESEYADKINLVYCYNWDNKDIEEKVAKADYIFSFSSKSDVPDFVWKIKSKICKVYGIGTKNYGLSNGIIYKNRNNRDYFEQVAELSPGYYDLNKEWKAGWGDSYVDMLTPSLINETHVRVFTDDNRYISQDCRHLTQAGAQWYARILDLKNIFDYVRSN